MTVSKSAFYKNLEGCECHEIFHPWNKSCFMASVELAVSSFIGTNKFYNIYYLVQLFLKRDQLTKEYLAYLAKCWLKSSVHGTFMGVVWLITNCVYRNLFGDFNYYMCGFVSGAIGGLGIMFETRSRRGLCHATFYSVVLDILYRSLIERRVCAQNIARETLTFMVANALLMYCVRAEVGKQSPLWFFIPTTPVTQMTTANIRCSQQQEHFLCQQGYLRQLAYDTAKYFCIGMAMQSVPQMLTKLGALRQNPRLLVKLLRHENNIKFATLMSSYVLVYKMTTSWFSQLTNKDSAWHSLPAGFLSGGAYLLQPNTTILFTAISNLLIICGRQLKAKGWVPDWPFGELAYAVCNGIMFHYRGFHPEICPAFVVKMMDTSTNGKAATLSDTFQSRMRPADEAATVDIGSSGQQTQDNNGIGIS